MARQVTIEIRDTTNNVVGTLDLTESRDFPIALTYLVYDAQNISKNSGFFSKKFKVKSTKNNQDLLGYIYNANIIDTKNNKSAKPAIIFVDGIIVMDGELKVTNIIQRDNDKTYEMDFKGGASLWINQISTSTLRDLDLGIITDWDLDGLTDTIFSLDKSYPAVTHTFPLVNWGKSRWVMGEDAEASIPPVGLETINRQMIYLAKDIRPGVYIRSILDKIFENTGYQLISNFIESKTDFNFNRLIYLYSLDDKEEDKSRESISVERTVNQTGTTETKIVFNYEGSPTDLEFYDYSNSFASGTYTVPSTGIYKVDSWISMTDISGSPNTLGFRLRVNGNIVGNGGVVGAVPANGTLFDIQPGFNFTTYGEFKFNQGDEVEMHARDVNSNWRVNPDSRFRVVKKSKERIGNLSNVNEILRNDLQSNFISGVSELFNLRFDVNNISKVVTVEPRDDFYLDKTESIDWSNKIDISKEYTLTLMSNYKRDVRLKYSDGDTILDNINVDSTVDYGERRIELNDRFLKGETILGGNYFEPTFFETGIVYDTTVEFSGITLIDTAVNNDNFAITPKIWSAVAPIPDISFSSGRKILYRAAKEVTTSPWYLNEEAYDIIQGRSPQFLNTRAFFVDVDGTSDVNLSFADINGKEGLYNKYWRNTIDIINEGLLLNVFIKLTPIDINQLNLRKPVFFDHPDFYGYWTINKIIDYKPHRTESTKVELIKLRALNTE